MSSGVLDEFKYDYLGIGLCVDSPMTESLSVRNQLSVGLDSEMSPLTSKTV